MGTPPPSPATVIVSPATDMASTGDTPLDTTARGRLMLSPRLRLRLMLSTPATATDWATPGTLLASTPPATPPSPAPSSAATPLSPAPSSAATAMVVASPTTDMASTDSASTRPAIASSHQQAQKLNR